MNETQTSRYPSRNVHLQRQSFATGILAGIITPVALGAARAIGLVRLDLSSVLGAFLVTNPGIKRRAVGVSASALFTGVVTLVYLKALKRSNIRTTVAGPLMGCVHWSLAGLFLGLLPRLQHLARGHLPEQGYYAGRLRKTDVAAFFFGHLAFGAFMGWWAKPHTTSTSEPLNARSEHKKVRFTPKFHRVDH